MNFVKILAGAGPAPIVPTAEDAIGELMQCLMIVPEWIGREAAVSHHFRSDALIGLGAMIHQYLQIGVAMNINKTGCGHQPGAIHCLGRFGGRDSANFGDDSIAYQKVAGSGRISCTIDNCGVPEKDQLRFS